MGLSCTSHLYSLIKSHNLFLATHGDGSPGEPIVDRELVEKLGGGRLTVKWVTRYGAIIGV